METQRLMEIGEKLGLAGKELRDFIHSEQEAARAERQIEREATREDAIRVAEEAERVATREVLFGLQQQKRLRVILHAKRQLDNMNETCLRCSWKLINFGRGSPICLTVGQITLGVYGCRVIHL